MPFRDGTGPQGQGPVTGRGFGTCGDGRVFGRRFGFGRGWGRGSGRGWGFWSRPTTREQEKLDLESYRKDLESELEAVKAEEKSLKDDK
jgi:hypothetical protein